MVIRQKMITQIVIQIPDIRYTNLIFFRPLSIFSSRDDLAMWSPSRDTLMIFFLLSNPPVFSPTVAPCCCSNVHFTERNDTSCLCKILCKWMSCPGIDAENILRSTLCALSNSLVRYGHLIFFFFCIYYFSNKQFIGDYIIFAKFETRNATEISQTKYWFGLAFVAILKSNTCGREWSLVECGDRIFACCLHTLKFVWNPKECHEFAFARMLDSTENSTFLLNFWVNIFSNKKSQTLGGHMQNRWWKNVYGQCWFCFFFAWLRHWS